MKDWNASRVTLVSQFPSPIHCVGEVGDMSSKKLIQLKLNVGQQRQTSCKECFMTYSLGSEEDAKLHTRYHASFLKFHYKPKENDEFCGNIVLCSHNQQKIHTKLTALMNAVSSPYSHEKIYLYLHKTKILGALVLEKLDSFRVLRVSKDQVRDVSFKKTIEEGNFIGIQKIWVSKHYRRKGIATELFNHVQQKHVEKIAFSQPTEQGSMFALSVCTDLFFYS